MRFHAFGIFALTGLAALSFAAPVTFSASGVFTNATDSLSPDLIGQSFRFDIAYDSNAPEAGSYTSGSAQISYYDLTSFGATIGGESVMTNFFSTVSVIQDGTDSSFQFTGGYYAGGSNEGSIFKLVFRPIVPLQNTALPGSVDALGEVTLAEYDDVTGIGEYFVEGTATAPTALVSTQATPEPTTTIALALGSIALLRRRSPKVRPIVS